MGECLTSYFLHLQIQIHVSAKTDGKLFRDQKYKNDH